MSHRINNTNDEPSADDAQEPIRALHEIQDKLDSKTNFNDFLKTSDPKVGKNHQLAPIDEAQLVAPNRRKSLDPRAMNKTITHSTGQVLLSERQK